MEVATNTSVRITRGVPHFNIQIGPITDVGLYEVAASVVVSVSDFFFEQPVRCSEFYWVPINERALSWGYAPFFATKKILDLHCITREAPVYLGCSRGNHRSPLMAFCWLLSQAGATPDTVVKEFYSEAGEFGDLATVYRGHVDMGVIPPDLPSFYAVMNGDPTLSYQGVLKALGRHERIIYL